ncbi:MAG: FHA domain-containing protein [Phycisphaerales bacterium]|nr:FHA domain-containing protein [Phycisphaerales bacterium]MCB9864203.1 FHA domain-containing protein [Phycisphaerales bacterium]
MASLVVTSGNQSGQYYRLADTLMSVGRDPARDIQLVDPKVSRKHFEVRRIGRTFTLTPLRSVNPVRVNGEVVEHEIALRDLDAIDVGETRLRFCSDDDPARANSLDHLKRVEPRLRDDQTINNNDRNG